MNCSNCGYPLIFDFESDVSVCNLCSGRVNPARILFRQLPEWEFMTDENLQLTYAVACSLGVWVCVWDCQLQFIRRGLQPAQLPSPTGISVVYPVFSL